MASTFYPWVENDDAAIPEDRPAAERGVAFPDVAAPEAAAADIALPEAATQEARVAVLEDWEAPPRIVLVEPQAIRPFVDELTETTYRLAKEQGGGIPFMVIREIVENLIHAHFTCPVVAIWPGGNTIRFSDRGPGIPSKEQALEFGTTTATPAMKRYIRGVGFGLPYVRHFMDERGGTLVIEDNLNGGTVVTVRLGEDPSPAGPGVKTRTNAGSPSARAPQRTAERPSLTPPERQIIMYLREHLRVGPRELSRTFGGSEPTWSRRLTELERRGFVEKSGQKRELTARGFDCSELLAGLS